MQRYSRRRPGHNRVRRRATGQSRRPSPQRTQKEGGESHAITGNKEQGDDARQEAKQKKEVSMGTLNWLVVGFVGFFGLIGLLGVLGDALQRRAARKTVERLLALQPLRSWSEWALPAPESYALLLGVTHVKSDAFKLGLLQLIAMDVLAPEGGQAPEGGRGDTALRRGPAPGDALAGSLIPIYRLWAASAEDQVQRVEDRVVQDQIEEAKR
jgi:hypothetical protein